MVPVLCYAIKACYGCIHPHTVHPETLQRGDFTSSKTRFCALPLALRLYERRSLVEEEEAEEEELSDEEEADEEELSDEEEVDEEASASSATLVGLFSLSINCSNALAVKVTGII